MKIVLIFVIALLVSLKVNEQISGSVRNAPLPEISAAADSRVYLGGLPKTSKLYEKLKEPVNYSGSISRLAINNIPIDIGESATAPPEIFLSLTTNECYDNPCQNGGTCVPAHEHQGFRCDCEPEFKGNYCQFRTRFCGNNGKLSFYKLILFYV